MRFLMAIFPLLLVTQLATADRLAIATFKADVTPPLGTPLCSGAIMPAAEILAPLTARGIVLFPETQKPVVLCAVDWIGIANEGQDRWREALANAAGTTPDRVAVHALHPHDTPVCDFSTDAVLTEYGLGGTTFNVDFAVAAIKHTAAAVKASIAEKQPVSAIAAGSGEVQEVASNRRILGNDGRVAHVRWTATTDAAVRAFPVGTIDPKVQLVSFWNGDTPVAVLTYYATHPQSFYGKGQVSPDFVGMAREAREAALPGVLHVHFNGAGGNIGAGKWNDGAPENRPVLAAKLEAGMKLAWDTQKKEPLTEASLDWKSLPITLPAREEIDEAREQTVLKDPAAKPGERTAAATELVFRQRNAAGKGIPLSRLRINGVDILHMPGELFVEYQLMAQQMAPGRHVCMAAYGDYSPGYIGTEIAYAEGGYETELHVSRTSAAVETVLRNALEDLLK
ncbi:MAG: hypothetical protein HYV27_02090 [Candidatus Hydrogenedentes bacterium]|nr:hypothetical protein [Candidatus Hydrogenedentota bacterium]